MDFHKHASSSNIPSLCRKQLSIMVPENVHNEEQDRVSGRPVDTDVDIDLREVYFLIMHFLSAGPCQKGFAQLLNDLMEHQLLPRRYHAWYSRTGMCSGDENDDGVSVPLCYEKLIQRYSHVANDHLVKLLKQLILRVPHSPLGVRVSPSAADVPTLLGTGSFSLLACDQNEEKKRFKGLLPYLRWPHMQVDQVRGLNLRAIGGGFTRHHRAPSVHGACYAIAKPSTMVQRMQNIKRLRGHRNAVYCAIFDRSGRYVITGSDDRLVKIWSMETALCLASCRGHEGDITDLAVSLNNMLVASASNDFVIRVWHLPDGMPVSILQGHTGVVTTIAFSPKASYLLLSSSDDGTCRIWDARNSQCKPRIYVPKPVNAVTGRNNVPSSSTATQQTHQILCCAFNASGAIFVTGSSDTCARVWSTCKPGADDSGQPNYEIDLLSGHENDVNYVQFSGSAVMSRSAAIDALKEDHPQKFKNSWFSHDNIVTCSRDGSAIIWVAKSRRSHGKVIRWTKAYHLKVPPPPLPPQAPRGGPRRRILPTPRGVNMIVWSLDNRFVLAAIMDCRICVWNAADGSLVHSLTGHTESTYVLDVHPFNPRIAMSASYDGRTIIWDIWEGTPVKIFEIGRIKLVDGKFSPDGTSIVLSDDVGQIYFLNTGQGESQKDAKYDQFFLGDYRPLIRDAHSNVLDQETQLTPYRRNLQDPLCDSGMIPYTEPYQSMYQRRRLGALGMEYRPSSIRFAVGPDFSLGEDYQMMPLPDPDVIIEMPVLLDATYFEPENEAATDDTDSEYDAANEYFSEKGQESLGTSAYNDSQSDEENSEVKRRHNSRRRKEKRDAQLTAPSRSIKRKKLEHCDGSTSQNNPKKKLRNGHRPSRKKSSTAKTPRPQRVAAQNALNMFSKMPETPSGPEDEDDRSLSGSSDTETSFQYSDMQSDESDTKQLNKQHQNGKKPILDESVEVVEPVEPPRDEANVRNKRKLVLKLAIRDSQKTSLLGTGAHKSNSQDEFEPSSSIPHQEEDKLTSSRNEDPGLDETEEKPNQTINRLTIKYRPPDRAVDHPNTLENSEPRGSFGPSCSRSFDKECGDSGVENTAVGGDNYDELRENAQPVKTKIRIKSSGFSREEKTAKLKLVTKAENPGYRKDSSVLRTDAAGTDCMKEENVSDTSDSDPSFGVDFPEEETDAARRSRSIELKATSRDPDRVNGKLKVRKGERSMGTSKGLGSRSEEWISNSNVTVRSELTRQDNVYEDYLGLGLSHLGFAGTKLSWLMLPEHEPGYRYIPQLGDVVAYLMQGHQEYQESNPSHEKGPWVTMKGKLNAVEICQIERLDYSTLPGSGESCCKITLKFIDPSSKVSGKSFRLTLPELSNFPDFLVEKTRYDAAIMRDWSPGEKCSVWWRNDSGEGGSWWEGWIVSAQAKSSEFPDSPWERYEVQYESEDGPQPHCPWELHDLDARWEHPHIDFDVRNKFLSYFSKLEQSVKRNQDYYGIQKLQQASQKMDFLNRFAVPMSPGVIQSRLEHNYYRSVEAVKHDIQVMISNAFQYFGRNSQHSVKIKRLDEFFQRKFLSL